MAHKAKPRQATYDGLDLGMFASAALAKAAEVGAKRAIKALLKAQAAMPLPELETPVQPPSDDPDERPENLVELGIYRCGSEYRLRFQGLMAEYDSLEEAREAKTRHILDPM